MNGSTSGPSPATTNGHALGDKAGDERHVAGELVERRNKVRRSATMAERSASLATGRLYPAQPRPPRSTPKRGGLQPGVL
jgi:hypothetical protein